MSMIIRLSSTLASGLCALLVFVHPPAAAQSPQPQTQETRADSIAAARLWQEGDPGQRLHLRGRVTSTAGTPVSGAGVVLWQADGAGHYHEQRYRAQVFTLDNGEFRLTTAVPGQYYGLKHIHVMVSHPDYHPLSTQILFRGDPALTPEDSELAILLEEVGNEEGKVMVGSVEFVLEPF